MDSVLGARGLHYNNYMFVRLCRYLRRLREKYAALLEAYNELAEDARDRSDSSSSDDDDDDDTCTLM